LEKVHFSFVSFFTPSRVRVTRPCGTDGQSDGQDPHCSLLERPQNNDRFNRLRMAALCIRLRASSVN